MGIVMTMLTMVWAFDYGVESLSCEWGPSTTRMRQVNEKFMGVWLRREDGLCHLRWFDSVRQIATRLSSVCPLSVVWDINRSRMLVYIFL